MMRKMLAIVISIGLMAFFCAAHKHVTIKQEKKVIVVTTNIIADTVKNIVGDAATVHALMGCGVDPHLYRARESDVHKLASADIIFYNGLHLEGKMATMFTGMNRFTKTVAVADALEKSMLRVADFDDMYDPHVWFDVTLWIRVVRFIQEHMMMIDWCNAEVYKKNGDAYIQKLELLDNYVRERMSTIQHDTRIIVTAHDAFGYFGRAYNCNVIGLQGLSTDAEISTKDVQTLASYIVEKKIKALFLESSVPSRAIIAVQKAVEAQGWSVAIGDELFSDSLGDGTTHASTYCAMIKYNVDTFVRYLGDAVTIE
jgi:manganese/zinc/iron transport system substrate-binding protein